MNAPPGAGVEATPGLNIETLDPEAGVMGGDMAGVMVVADAADGALEGSPP